MKKYVKLLLSLSLASSLLSNSVVFANELVPSLKDENIVILSSSSRVVYTWESFDRPSFTRNMKNSKGHNVVVRFERTGAKRIVNGSPRYRYVGIIHDTDFGVTSFKPVVE